MFRNGKLNDWLCIDVFAKMAINSFFIPVFGNTFRHVIVFRATSESPMFSSDVAFIDLELCFVDVKNSLSFFLTRLIRYCGKPTFVKVSQNWKKFDFLSRRLFEIFFYEFPMETFHTKYWSVCTTYSLECHT